MGVRFSESRLDMHVLTDADWAGNVLARRSTTGYVMFAAGGPFAWGSQLQATVATSSMQSEYQGMYAGMQVTVWFEGGDGDFTSFVRTHAFLFRQSECRGLSNESHVS